MLEIGHEGLECRIQKVEEFPMVQVLKEGGVGSVQADDSGVTTAMEIKPQGGWLWHSKWFGIFALMSIRKNHFELFAGL